MTRGSRLAALLQCRPSLRLFSQHEEELKLCTAKEQREHDHVTNKLMFKLDMLHKGYAGNNAVFNGLIEACEQHAQEANAVSAGAQSLSLSGHSQRNQ